MHSSLEIISIIVPCFNEAESLPVFHQEFNALANRMDSLRFEAILIDDGSSDETLDIIKNLRACDERIHFISFSKNFGKEAAMLAGLRKAKGNYVAIVDVDGQDPLSLIEEMYSLLCNSGDKEEWDCIATRRVSRKGEPLVRSFFARSFYRVINKISNVQIVDGARDFRLMKRNMVNAILSLGEKNRFSKGIFVWVGFKIKYLEYENIERRYGETKWSFWKLFAYSIDGIISFSTAPLILMSITGVMFCILAFSLMIFFLLQKLIVGIAVAGYAAMICIILFLGGVQLFGLGVLGQYIAKVFTEVKNRPVYIVRESSASNSDTLIV